MKDFSNSAVGAVSVDEVKQLSSDYFTPFDLGDRIKVGTDIKTKIITDKIYGDNKPISFDKLSDSTKQNLISENQKQTNSGILDKLIVLVRRYINRDVRQLSPQQNLGSDLGFDSIDLLQFVSKIESMFTIQFTDDEVVRLQTVNDVLSIIHYKKQ